MQRLAGITGKVAIKGYFEMIIDPFLQNFPRHTAAENKKIVGNIVFVQGDPFRTCFIFHRHDKAEGRLRIFYQLTLDGDTAAA